MLEESISCSPGNNGKKSHSRRFHKKSKKKCEKYNITPTSDNLLSKEPSGLEALYEETTHSGIINATTHEYFNPFENEKLLAAADFAEASKSRNKLENLTSEGFVRLENLSFKEENKTFTMKPPESHTQCQSTITPRSPHLLGSETQFGITESEFVRFCDDAESEVLVQSTTDVKNQTISDVIVKDINGSTIESDVETKNVRKSKSVVEEILTDFCGSPTDSEILEHTPPNSLPKNLKGTKSIVDEILEDFCGSPYKESSPKENSEDSTPVFRFKSQPIRTYSGIRKKNLFRRNIATNLNAFTLKDDGNTSDSSSGLSVQEDLSQSIVPQLDTVDLNNSVKLCENLLNLNSFFTQLTSSSKERSPSLVVDEVKDVRLTKIVEEILKLKSKSLRINWNEIEEEFMGFSDYESYSKESTLQELLEDEDDVLQQINCDSLCYERVDPKNSFANFDRDMENTLKNASAVIEKAKALIFSGDDVNQKAESWRNKYQPDCDIHTYTQNKPLQNSPLKDEQLFEDIDIWNDNECLLNYKTQKPYPKRVEHGDNQFFKDEFNETKLVYKGKDSPTRNSITHKNHDTKAQALPYCYNWKALKDQKPFENVTDPCSSVSLKLSVTSRDNQKYKSNELNLNEYKTTEIGRQINAIDAVPYSKEKNAACEFLPDNTFSNKKKDSNFIGFTTVSKKPIFISDIAKQKANDFLEKVEQEFEEKMALNNNEFSKDDIKSNLSTIQAHNPSCSLKELSTTFKKPMLSGQISEIIKTNTNEKCNQSTREIDFQENKEKIQTELNISSGKTSPKKILINNCSVGFFTASKKLISISNKAKQKADEILMKFEKEEQEKRILEPTFETTGKFIGSASKKTVEDTSTVCGFVGFSTASEKPIAISLEAKHKANEIMKKFEQAEKIVEDKNDMAMEKLTQRDQNEVSEEVRRKAQELLLDIEFFEEAFEDELKKIEAGQLSQVQDEKHRAEGTFISSSSKLYSQATKGKIVEGFKTASRKSIHISEEANLRAETFFKAAYDEDLPQEFLKCIEKDINNTNVNVNKNPVGNIMDTVEQVDGAMKSPPQHFHDVPRTESEHMHAINVLEMKNRNNNQRTSDLGFERLREKKEDRRYDGIDNIKRLKRKHSEGHELEKLSSHVPARRLSCGERTPLNRIENGLLCKSSSLPLKECTPNSTLISRKNLLSLSKRRKYDSSGQIIESKSRSKTPEKEQHSSISHCNANSTPNLKDFFDSVSTSTPRLIRNDPTDRSNQDSSKYTIDSDFQPIQWEDSNNSFRINRTSCVDDINVTFSQVSPSPKQRIERLKMYGEPPPISPILMINKCRPSGLRRGRSAMKP